MRVQEQNRRRRLALAVAQLDPGYHSRQRAIPAFAAGRLRRLTEPKMSFIQLGEAIVLVVQGHHLTLLFAVIPADAEHGMAGKLLSQIVPLKTESLLCAE